jgi:hypothetical protein
MNNLSFILSELENALNETGILEVREALGSAIFAVKTAEMWQDSLCPRN